MVFSLNEHEEQLGVKLLDGRPYYLSIEGVEKLKRSPEFDLLLDRLNVALDSKEVHHCTVTVEASSELKIQVLENNFFALKSESIEYYKSFQMEKMHFNHNSSITYKLVDERDIKLFLEMWQACSEGSLNAPSAHPIEMQYEAMKQEIGEQYKSSCYSVYWNKNLLGVVIPIIEPDTEEEGRLFYMGVLPQQRGKGFGKQLHQLGLFLLQEKGATYYIGSTGVENKPMQQIFQYNDCHPIFHAVTYTKASSEVRNLS